MFDNPYLRHHKRFLLAAFMGVLAWFPAGAMAHELRLLVAGDVFFAVYLASMLILTLGTTEEGLRERAKTEDEGILIIALLTLLAIAFSLVSILTLFNKAGGPDRVGLVLALVSVPLGWLTLHSMAAQHYANLFYSPGPTGAVEAGGLDFPGDEAPVIWDFLYFAFVIGMTAQTADVGITASRMRKVVLAHGIAAFFFNTVLVAVAVNAAVANSG